jgi:hypothetical protein
MQETATRMAPSSEVEGRLYITQSPYYSPAFNGAVFDGPLRLYFSQSQEALALKFYFELRAKTQSMTEQWPRSGGVNLFVMIYPTEETFDLCFLSQGLQWTPETLPLGRLGRDYVVAVQAHELEGDMMSITKKLTALIGALTPLAEGPR